MKEVRQILDAVVRLAIDETAVMATVVDLQGSGYRLPGARMLIRANGDAIGTVSGGCLEADVLERAKRVIETRRAELFTYDTTTDENSVFSLNMGCRGVMRILLEPVTGDSEIIQQLAMVYSDRQPVRTAVAVSGSVLGERIFVTRDQVDDPAGVVSSFPGLRDDLLTFAGSTTQLDPVHYDGGNGLTEFVFETLLPPVQLIVLGAGADGVPLAENAHALGWNVKVYDHRPAYLNHQRFPEADELVLLDRDGHVEIDADSRTAIVVMNHNYDRDKQLLTAALDTEAFYVGALGPKKRTQQILQEIGAAGHTFAPERLEALRSPAGLDIGGDSPELIAVSIIAEIQSVLRHRPGGPLRDRTAPIYDHH